MNIEVTQLTEEQQDAIKQQVLAARANIERLAAVVRTALAKRSSKRQRRFRIAEATEEKELEYLFAEQVVNVIAGSGSSTLDSAIRPGNVGILGNRLIFNCSAERELFFQGLGLGVPRRDL